MKHMKHIDNISNLVYAIGVSGLAGWMIGNARINSSQSEKEKAAKILASGLNIQIGRAHV